MLENQTGNPKVLVACNTLTSISGECYPYHMKLFYRLGRRHQDYDFMQLFATRMSIDRFRNHAAEVAIANNCKYLMFIDDDMKITPDTFAKLVEGCDREGYGILAALNYIRGYPFKIMSFKWDMTAQHRRLINLTQRDINTRLTDIIPCEAIGTAVCMIAVKYLKTTPKPYFLTGPHGTEDIYMCLKVKESNPSVKIGTHVGLETGHLIDPEIISHGTRTALMEYYEKYMTEDEIAAAKKDLPSVALVPDVGNRELHYEDLMGSFYEGLVEVANK